MRRNSFIAALQVFIMCVPTTSLAAGIPALTLDTAPDGSQNYTLSLQILAVMTALTLLPAFVLMMTSFTRVVIVLSLLRQALGTPQTPPNQIIVGLSLFLSLFIMQPVFSQVYDTAIAPYMNDNMGFQQAVQAGKQPFRTFMLNQTRENDVELFMEIGNIRVDSVDEVPMSVLIPAFITSELKTAFQIGFLIFLPFLVIDLVVASVLMAMGMMMLSPMLISLPFKIMLFVLVDGWGLLIGTLARSFFI